MSKTTTTAVKFRVVGKIRAFCFLPSLIEASGDDERNYFRGEGTIRL
jgi:hypothetical protein